MRLQFTLRPDERLECSECGAMMKSGDIVHIVPDLKIEIFRCFECTKRATEQLGEK